MNFDFDYASCSTLPTLLPTHTHTINIRLRLCDIILITIVRNEIVVLLVVVAEKLVTFVENRSRNQANFNTSTEMEENVIISKEILKLGMVDFNFTG